MVLAPGWGWLLGGILFGGEFFLPALDLALDLFGSGRSGLLAFGHGAAEVEEVEAICGEVGMDAAVIFERELVQGFAEFLGFGDDGTDDVVGLSEGDVMEHEGIGEVGGEEGGVTGGLLADGGIDAGGCDHGGEEPGCGADSVGTIEEAFLILLEVSVIGHGQAFEEGEEGGEVADSAGGFAAAEFSDVGIFLLGHEGGAGGVGIAEPDEVELAGGPEHVVFGEAGEVDGEEGGGATELDGEVAVADGVHAVLGDAGPALGIDETEVFGD